MKAQFHFSLLRFVYDPLTQEFLNIGVVLFSPESNFLQARFTNRYGRISRMPDASMVHRSRRLLVISNAR